MKWRQGKEKASQVEESVGNEQRQEEERQVRSPAGLEQNLGGKRTKVWLSRSQIELTLENERLHCVPCMLESLKNFEHGSDSSVVGENFKEK